MGYNSGACPACRHGDLRSIRKPSVCFVVDIVTPAPVLSRRDRPPPNYHYAITSCSPRFRAWHNETSSGSIASGYSFTLFRRNVTRSGSDTETVKSSLPDRSTIASHLPSGQLWYTPGQLTGAFLRFISQRLSNCSIWVSCIHCQFMYVWYANLRTVAVRSVVINSDENFLICLFQTG